MRRGAEPEAMSITVAAPARLHLGFLDPSGGLGRRFAGIGLALGELGTRINVRIAASTHIEGPEQGRVQRYLDAMRQHLGVRDTYAIRVEETVAAHVGLGSGTQIALAVAAGIRRLHDLPLDVIGDAVRLRPGEVRRLRLVIRHLRPIQVRSCPGQLRVSARCTARNVLPGSRNVHARR